MDQGCRRCPKDDHFVEVMDPDDPITAGIDKKWMNVFDDLFTHVIVHPEARAFVTSLGHWEARQKQSCKL